jgi:hypothetical protein
MIRSAAPLSVLFLACLLPVSAHAATSARALCVQAERDPSSFVAAPDFADRLLKMSTSCPELALALTNTATGTIADVTRAGSKDKNLNSADFSDLVDRLRVATRNLDAATANVEQAQAALDRSIRRAKGKGLSEADLQALYAMEGEGTKMLLPDFNKAKRDALENYIDARDRLAVAEGKLDQANEKAKPLVEKALELAGKANVAEADLASALDGLSAADKQAMLDKALSEAKQSLADLEGQITEAEAAFDAASKALKSALNEKHYTRAVKDVEEETEDYTRAAKNFDEAKEKFAAAEARFKEHLAEDAQCKGRDCRDAKADAFTAGGKLAVAKLELNREERHLEKAQKDLAKIEEALGLAGLTESYDTQAAALAAAQAKQAMARDLADAASRQSKELNDLLSAAADALTRAQAASDEAKAATAAEEAEVAAASAALEKALAEAKAAVEGTPEEWAAVEAVYEAKVDLIKALDALGAAQVDADALTEEVAALPEVPTEVKDAAEDLTKAADAGDAAAEEAQDSVHAAGEALNENYNSGKDLRAALEEDMNEDKETEEKVSDETGDEDEASEAEDSAEANS